jgi:hypothetical protein
MSIPSAMAGGIIILASWPPPITPTRTWIPSGPEARSGTGVTHRRRG